MAETVRVNETARIKAVHTCADTNERLAKTQEMNKRLERDNLFLTNQIAHLSKELSESRAYAEQIMEAAQTHNIADFQAREEKYKRVILNLRNQIRTESVTVPINEYKAALAKANDKEGEANKSRKLADQLSAEVVQLQKRLTKEAPSQRSFHQAAPSRGKTFESMAKRTQPPPPPNHTPIPVSQPNYYPSGLTQKGKEFALAQLRARRVPPPPSNAAPAQLSRKTAAQEPVAMMTPLLSKPAAQQNYTAFQSAAGTDSSRLQYLMPPMYEVPAPKSAKAGTTKQQGSTSAKSLLSKQLPSKTPMTKVNQATMYNVGSSKTTAAQEPKHPMISFAPFPFEDKENAESQKKVSFAQPDKQPKSAERSKLRVSIMKKVGGRKGLQEQLKRARSPRMAEGQSY
jgi:hypothetical protein